MVIVDWKVAVKTKKKVAVKTKKREGGRERETEESATVAAYACTSEIRNQRLA
jgi:hypothetical protein